MNSDRIERIRATLAPYPAGYSERAAGFALELLASVVRTRTVDEAVWHQILELASLTDQWHAIDKHLRELGVIEDKALISHPMAQHRSHLSNTISAMRSALLVTPRARRTATESGQTSFLSELEGAGPAAAETGDRAVPAPIPFRRPEARR